MLVKIDVEGHDLRALQGLRALLKRGLPVVSIEAETHEYADTISQFMSALSYDVYDFVTDAFNAHNFAGHGYDIWSGAGKCVNLLCVVDGKHGRPKNLPLRRAATAGDPQVHVTDSTGDARAVLRGAQTERDALAVELAQSRRLLNAATNDLAQARAEAVALQARLYETADLSRAYAVAALHVETLSFVRHEQDTALAEALREAASLRHDRERVEVELAALSAAAAAEHAEVCSRAELQQATAAADFARFRDELRLAREEAAAARAELAQARGTGTAPSIPETSH